MDNYVLENTVKSLYQAAVFIEDETYSCNIIDFDKDFSHIDRDLIKNYQDLFDMFYKNIHPEDREEFSTFGNIEHIHEELSQKVFISCEYRLRHADSRYYRSRIIVCNVKKAESSDGREYLFLIQDISRQKDAEFKKIDELKKELYALQEKYDRLFVENMTDFQTGCLNRKGLVYYEGIVLNEAKEGEKELLVCVLDLNGLKHLNDTYGHSAGDIALKAIADALKSSAPEGARIIRTGGDEFLIIAALDNAEENSCIMEQGMKRFLDEFNRKHDYPYEVSASYGFASGKNVSKTEELDLLIEQADKKMYVMKEETDPYKR